MATDDVYPPLVSPRSPSYERARRELAHPSPAGDANVVAGLARLAELEHEAAQACDRGADAIAEVDLAQRLHEDAAVHRARRESLAELIAGLGGSAPSEGESRKLLTHGLTAVQDAATNQAVLDSLLAMRDELSAAYREVAALPALDAQRQAAIAALAPSEG